MREKEKTRVIWRHPQGRFEIQETEHYSLFDHCTYYTRECVFTPQDDARGLCSEVPTAIYVPEEIKQEGRWQPRVTDEEKQRLAKMYQAGMPIRAISRETGRAYEDDRKRAGGAGLQEKEAAQVGSLDVRGISKGGRHAQARLSVQGDRRGARQEQSCRAE